MSQEEGISVLVGAGESLSLVKESKGNGRNLLENKETQLPKENQIREEKTEKSGNNFDTDTNPCVNSTSSTSTTQSSSSTSSKGNAPTSSSTTTDLLINRAKTISTFPTARKSPSLSLLKSNNNNTGGGGPSISTSNRPSFPSLVIALLNTVRAGGESASANNTNTLGSLVKSEKVGAERDKCDVANLNLNTLNANGLAESSSSTSSSRLSNANAFNPTKNTGAGANTKSTLNNTNNRIIASSRSLSKAEDENGNDLGENAESTPAIKLPENLEGLMRADHFPCQRHRWNTNEEIAAILISFAHHPEWLSKEVKIRPKSGSMLLYSRKKVRYRRDGYCWKKRKDGKTTREDHMKLKVQGTECIYGCYVHSAILPTFHRRCYWLLQNPDIVLVHYLNVPYPDDNKLIITSNVSMWGDKKEWTKEELISQLKPMFFSEEEPDLNNELELSTAETVEAIVMQLMEKQRLARQTASETLAGVTVNGVVGNNSGGNTSSNSHGVVNVNGNLNGTTPSNVSGGPGSARHSSSSSTSSLVQIPNIPSNGPSIVATVTTSSAAIGANNGSHTTGLVTTSVNPKSMGNEGHTHLQQQQQQQNNTRVTTAVNLTASGNGGSHTGSDRPFVLNLSQFQTAGGLIILNGKPTVTTPSGGVGVSQCHTATVQTTHHQQALAAVQNLNNSNGSLASTLTASFMDVQNANENVNNGSGSGRVTNSTSNQQTLLIHHSQNQQHFATALATAQQNLQQQQQQHHNSHNSHNHSHQHHQQQQSQGSHPQQQQQQQQHTVHHPPNNGTGSHGASNLSHNNHGGNQTHHQHPSQPGGDHTSNSANQHQQQQQQQQQQELLTLEMSHEDIQQTLSANMGMGDNSGDLEPMSPSADDVFVNLDAFDILADLSDDLDQSHHNGVLMGGHNGSEKTTIVDINPEWAYSEGGTKILIVGQFHNPHWDYSVHFGDLPVPAVYLQAGVLKCFCPPHSPGLVPIRVYSNGKQISNNSMVFEYKADMKVNLVPVPPSETSLKLCLIHRMECLEKCFHNFKGDEYGARSLEDSVVKMCVEMMSQEWVMGAGIPFATTLPDDRGMTLLHLAAALGYTRLVLTLIQWKRENPSNVLDSEVDPWMSDDFGLIPLMWCARHGHLECGIILGQWSPDTLQKRGSEGLNPAQIAVARGHVKLASELEKIQNNRTPASEFVPGLGCEELSLTSISNLRRFQRCSSSISEDFGLKDCFFGQPDATSELSLASEEDSKVLTLAEQIIAAIPDRIKKESSEEMSPCESQDSSMMSSDPSDTAEFSFEFSDRNYRYYDTGTPCSSLSPSSSCLQSPCSSFTVDSPQPTTADFCEFLQAAAFEKDFSNLTLSDREQRELYEAAKVIQKAYRSYKGRKKLEEEEKEKAAAVIIQNYYRRYKQYAYLRQVTQAALVIQSQYRNYCENKRFKKSQETEGGFLLPRDGTLNSVNSQHPILRTYSQRRQHQAAKKIQQFMRQSKNNIWETEEPPKITERACRKREATMSITHGVLCPAPAKIALSSVQQQKSQKHQQQQKHLHHQQQQQQQLSSAF